MRMVMAIVLMVVLSGCVTIPASLVESFEVVHAGNIVIAEGYFAYLSNDTGNAEARAEKMRFVIKWLRLSEELNDFLQKHKGDNDGVE